MAADSAPEPSDMTPGSIDPVSRFVVSERQLRAGFKRRPLTETSELPGKPPPTPKPIETLEEMQREWHGAGKAARHYERELADWGRLVARGASAETLAAWAKGVYGPGRDVAETVQTLKEELAM